METVTKMTMWKENLLALVSQAQALTWVTQEQVKPVDILSRMSMRVKAGAEALWDAWSFV